MEIIYLKKSSKNKLEAKIITIIRNIISNSKDKMFCTIDNVYIAKSIFENELKDVNTGNHLKAQFLFTSKIEDENLNIYKCSYTGDIKYLIATIK